MAKTCSNCDYALVPDWDYCPSCGKKIGNKESCDKEKRTERMEYVFNNGGTYESVLDI
jgi:predicted amidophosphoribosyltransferase